jgi:hypothetical protein
MNDPQSKILAYLKQGGRLTVQKAIHLFSTTELRKIISRLRRQGYPILDRRLTVTTADGRQAPIKEYYLQSE